GRAEPGEATTQPPVAVPLPADAEGPTPRHPQFFHPDGSLVRVPQPLVPPLPFLGEGDLLGQRPVVVAPQVEAGAVGQLPGDEQPAVLGPLPADAVGHAVAVGLLGQQPPLGEPAVLIAVLDAAPLAALVLQEPLVVPQPHTHLLAAQEVGGG